MHVCQFDYVIRRWFVVLLYHCYMFGLEPNNLWILPPIYQNEIAEVIDNFGCVSLVFPFTAFTVVRGATSVDGDAVSQARATSFR